MAETNPLGASPAEFKDGPEDWGNSVSRVVISDGQGVTAGILTHGARLQSLLVDGEEWTLGFDHFAPYLEGGKYYGAIVGRVANRIAAGRFEETQLDLNEGDNHLHGGTQGSAVLNWSLVDFDQKSVTLSREMRHADDGYPGDCTVTARYSFDKPGQLGLEISATVTARCPINFASHAYFDLGVKGAVTGHRLQVLAHEVMMTDGAGIPQHFAPVSDVGFDYRLPRILGDAAGGTAIIDNSFRTTGKGMRRVARLSHGDKRLTYISDQPDVQVYTGRKLPEPHSGIALEPQMVPDAPNHPEWGHPEWGDVFLEPGDTYRQRLVFQIDNQAPETSTPHNPSSLKAVLAPHPRFAVGHWPTPLERADKLSADLGIDLWIKRDDCSGVGLGGNKVRQLEYYVGKAKSAYNNQGADSLLITGAIQSNFARTTAAFAAKAGMACHIQLEERVPNITALHRENGNVLLNRLFGATLSSFPVGEDEDGADKALYELAAEMEAKGKRPFVVPLSGDQPPTGSLGYMQAALEIDHQVGGLTDDDVMVVASGSAITHVGLLMGLRLMGRSNKVVAICVRRDAAKQTERVTRRLDDLAELLGVASPIQPDDIIIDDLSLAPGYGLLNDATREAIDLAARKEALLVDPTYTGKVFAGLIAKARGGEFAGKRVIFWHTGGTPALFAYADKLELGS